MALSVDKFGVTEEYEGEETHIDFEDMNDKTYNEIIDKFETEISLLEADRDFVKKKYKEESES